MAAAAAPAEAVADAGALMRLSVILPAHNEEPNIATMVQRLLRQYGRHILEVIVVDDASTDHTAAVIRRLAGQDARVRLVRRRRPSGVGRALKAGFKAVDLSADYVLMMDSDFLACVPQVQRLIDKIREGYDGVVGSRFVRGGRLVGYPWPKRIANRAFHLLARWLLGIAQRDLTNNFKLYKIEIIKTIRWRNTTFAINAETGVLPLLHHFRIAEVPVSWIERSKSMGLSNFNILRVGPQYGFVLWNACLLRWTDLWRGFLNPTPHPRAVQHHYARLSSHYTVRENPSCRWAYEGRVRKWLGGATRLLEIGCGMHPIVAALPGRSSTVVMDFSVPMLGHRLTQDGIWCVAGDAQRLPLAAQSVNGVVSVNLAEHLQKPAAMIQECARVLEAGGTLMVITPNARMTWALELAELLRLKLPEGPHRFLTPARLRAIVERAGFDVLDHERFLLFPVRVRGLADAVERLRACVCPGIGLSQCVVARKRPAHGPVRE